MCLLRRLGSDGSPKSNLPKINPNLIANRIIEMSRASSHKQLTMDIKNKLSNLKKVAVRRGTLSAPFTLEEINMAITKLRSGNLLVLIRSSRNFTNTLVHALELG